jgi:2-methylcitrate dehydratase PrpD
MGIIEDKLADFVVDTKFHNIPKHVVEYTKHTILKTTAGMAYGSTTIDGKKIIRLIKGSLPQEAGVIGHGIRVPLDKAALANGFFAHAAELEDDCFPTSTSDITVVPVIFPLADALRLSGKEVIEATAVAHEVMNRFEHAINPGGRVERVEQLGFTSLSFYGVIGAAAAACKAFGLNATQTKSAMGLAIATASGFIMNFGTTAHYYESAIACQNGIVTALLAKEGCTGNPDVRRWIGGLLGDEKLQVDKIVENLGGEPWYACNFWIKKYPVCFLTHRHIDAILEMRKEHTFTYDQVDRVEVDLGPIDATVDRPVPKDLEDARFSVQHIIASLLIDGDVSPETLTWEKILDPKVKELRTKVKPVIHPEWPRAYMSGIAKVTIYLKDGRVLVRERDQVVGGPKYPLTREHFIELYEKYAKTLLTEPQIKESVNLITNLEKLGDLERLVDIVVFRK